MLDRDEMPSNGLQRSRSGSFWFRVWLRGGAFCMVIPSVAFGSFWRIRWVHFAVAVALLRNREVSLRCVFTPPLTDSTHHHAPPTLFQTHTHQLAPRLRYRTDAYRAFFFVASGVSCYIARGRCFPLRFLITFAGYEGGAARTSNFRALLC